jgi:hypothetical protein
MPGYVCRTTSALLLQVIECRLNKHSSFLAIDHSSYKDCFSDAALRGHLTAIGQTQGT